MYANGSEVRHTNNERPINLREGVMSALVWEVGR